MGRIRFDESESGFANHLMLSVVSRLSVVCVLLKTFDVSLRDNACS